MGLRLPALGPCPDSTAHLHPLENDSAKGCDPDWEALAY
jgi:hypothetical protein